MLVCVYGAAGISPTSSSDVESQARRIHALQRVELRRTAPETPCMLFAPEEVDFIVRKFARSNDCGCEREAVDYLIHSTDGHPGMLGLLLNHVEELWKVSYIFASVLDLLTGQNGEQKPRQLTAAFFHRTIVDGERSQMKYLSDWGRGVWSPWTEKYVKGRLNEGQYKRFKLHNIKNALGQIARQPYGLKRVQVDFDAFAFCHKMGLVHAESSKDQSEETTFTFASPLHRRVAYRRIFAAPEPDLWHGITLQQTCMNAIARFSPAVFQTRRLSGNATDWDVPERAVQNELYHCLQLEFCRFPILSEYSHTRDGRIDFYVSDRRWGIEIVRCGSSESIHEHASRFMPGGKYENWKIMDDFIILNFCPNLSLPIAKIEGRSRLSTLPIIIELTKSIR